MPDGSGVGRRFAGSSALLRLVSKTADGLLLFPECVSDRERCGPFRAPVWNLQLDHRGHALEHIVAQHEVVKESCGRMAHS
jgi:hypothetical protein